MVAYSFQPQFVAPILAGTKRQTIRADRRRHARPGEEMQLYTGMRTKGCRLIRRVRCVETRGVTLDLVGDEVREMPVDGHFCFRAPDLDAFAVRDGFPSWSDLKAFWAKHHPGVEEFRGVLVRWEVP